VERREGGGKLHIRSYIETRHRYCWTHRGDSFPKEQKKGEEEVMVVEKEGQKEQKKEREKR